MADLPPRIVAAAEHQDCDVIVSVDSRSAVPPYEQIRAQLVMLIRAGSLAPGSRLPAIRQLAADLGLATGTVARAYAEVEREGLLVARGRHGTVVAEDVVGETANSSARLRRLQDAASLFASEATRLGVSVSDALAAARVALDFRAAAARVSAPITPVGERARSVTPQNRLRTPDFQAHLTSTRRQI